MPVRCWVPGCKSRVACQRLPKNDIQSRLWIKLISNEDLKGIPRHKMPSHVAVCREHFVPSDFSCPGRLKRGAFPTRNLQPITLDSDSDISLHEDDHVDDTKLRIKFSDDALVEYDKNPPSLLNVLDARNFSRNSLVPVKLGKKIKIQHDEPSLAKIIQSERPSVLTHTCDEQNTKVEHLNSIGLAKPLPELIVPPAYCGKQNSEDVHDTTVPAKQVPEPTVPPEDSGTQNSILAQIGHAVLEKPFLELTAPPDNSVQNDDSALLTMQLPEPTVSPYDYGTQDSELHIDYAVLEKPFLQLTTPPDNSEPMDIPEPSIETIIELQSEDNSEQQGQLKSSFDYMYNARPRKTNVVENVPVTKFKCPICGTERTKQQLLHHYKNEHKLILSTVMKRFSTRDEFIQWKKKIEIENGSKFVKKYVPNFDHCLLKYEEYICHRNGLFKLGKSKTSLEFVGSERIDSYCPAKMKVHISPNGLINVTYTSSHLGHTMTEVTSTVGSEQERIEKKLKFDAIQAEAVDFMSCPNNNNDNSISSMDLEKNLENVTFKKEKIKDDLYRIIGYIDELKSDKNFNVISEMLAPVISFICNWRETLHEPQVMTPFVEKVEESSCPKGMSVSVLPINPSNKEAEALSYFNSTEQLLASINKFSPAFKQEKLSDARVLCDNSFLGSVKMELKNQSILLSPVPEIKSGSRSRKRIFPINITNKNLNPVQRSGESGVFKLSQPNNFNDQKTVFHTKEYSEKHKILVLPNKTQIPIIQTSKSPSGAVSGKLFLNSLKQYKNTRGIPTKPLILPVPDSLNKLGAGKYITCLPKSIKLMPAPCIVNKEPKKDNPILLSEEHLPTNPANSSLLLYNDHCEKSVPIIQEWTLEQLAEMHMPNLDL